MNWIQDINFTVLDFIQEYFRCPFLDFLMPAVSFLGNYGMIWIITAVVLFFTKNYRINGVMILFGLILGLLIGNVLLKNIIAAARPFTYNDSITLLISEPKDYSFPSGHTLSSFIAALLLTFSNKKFAYTAFPFAVIIAFSRLYLYVHFLTDVLAGAVLGLLIGYAVWRFFNLTPVKHFIDRNSKFQIKRKNDKNKDM